MTVELRGDRLKDLQAHATINSLLARAMNYPDAALADSLTSGEFATTLLAAVERLGENQTRKEIASLRQEAEAATSQAQVLLELEREYTRLFFVSKPRIAYLFESAYREGKLLQESTFEVARLYRDAGLALKDDFALPADHIAVELEFLSFLFYQELEASRNGRKEVSEYARELRKTFVEGHLQPFALSVAERLLEHARCPLFKIAAVTLRNYLAWCRGLGPLWPTEGSAPENCHRSSCDPELEQLKPFNR